MIVGIDASNIRAGGGVTHLVELLGAADPVASNITKVVVWGSRSTLCKIADREWLQKVEDPALERGILRRTFWQRFELSDSADAHNCDVLFVPGGNDVSKFASTVVMSQNMLPFEWHELFRFGISALTFRFVLLRFSQGRSFRNASGVIFLTTYARDGVVRVIGKMLGTDTVISHGLNSRFFLKPRRQRLFSEFTAESPCRLVYVSIVHLYKHHWHVIEAVSRLRNEGIHVTLELVGPPASGTSRLKHALKTYDSGHEFVNYRGEVPYEELHKIYGSADVGIFASTCENLPNILLEKMAAGLPVACSNFGPMPEVLGSSGVYFSPEQPGEIADALRQLIFSADMRKRLAQDSYQKAQKYTWEECARQTFDFLARVSCVGKLANTSQSCDGIEIV